MGTKNLKGTVSIEIIGERIRLRWRFQKKRFSLNLFQFTKANLLKAKVIAVNIERDLDSDHFDPCLDRYKPLQVQESFSQTITLVTYFEDWVRNYRNMSCDRDIDYYSIRSMMLRWGDFDSSTVMQHFNKETFSPRTYNRRLTILKAFFNWTKKTNLTSGNPLEDVLPKKVRKTEKPNREPFTIAEIRMILNAFKENTFCSKHTIFKHSHYFPFIFFMFKTGVRNAEAIGLRVKDVNIEKNFIHIREVLARSIKGSNATARIRKETKNGKQRVLPLTDDLLEVIKPLLYNKKPDDLVFISQTGKAIDDAIFQKRVFQKILSQLNIKHRVLYACRHTFNSRCIESGISPVTTAFLMGNSPETALRSYTHLLSLPGALPDIK